MTDDDFRTRAAAEKYLIKMSHIAETELRNALAKKPPLDVRLRIERVMATAASGPPTQQQKRVIRAIGVLEEIGSQEAKLLLRRLADGEPDALPTREARATLRRLEEYAHFNSTLNEGKTLQLPWIQSQQNRAIMSM